MQRRESDSGYSAPAEFNGPGTKDEAARDAKENTTASAASGPQAAAAGM